VEGRHEIVLITFMKMHRRLHEGLTTSGVPDFHSLAELRLSKMKRRNVGGKEVKDTLTRLTRGQRNNLVFKDKMGRDEISNTVDKVWDALALYIMNMSLLTMELKGLSDPANGGNLVDMGVGVVDGIANYAFFVVTKELDLFVREKGQYLLLNYVVKVAEFVMEMVSCLSVNQMSWRSVVMEDSMCL